MRERTYITILEWIIVMVMLAAIVAAVNTGIKKEEIKECLKWQEWTELYPNFTASERMREQCNNYQIKLERNK